MTAETVIKYLNEHNELFCNLIEQLDSWNGYLGDDRWISMYDLNETLSSYSADDIIRMAQNSSFDLGDDYFRFDGYGSIESTYGDPDYSEYLDENFVKELVNNINHIVINDPKLKRMLRSLTPASNWKGGDYE